MKLSRYYRLTAACLISFHGFTKAKAIKVCSSLARQIKKDMHVEPFNLACDLSGKELDFQDTKEKYAALRDAKNLEKVMRLM